jgi:hypothetical protein
VINNPPKLLQILLVCINLGADISAGYKLLHPVDALSLVLSNFIGMSINDYHNLFCKFLV